MADQTLTAMYDTRDAAAAAQHQLAGLGVPSGNIAIHGGETGTTAESTEEEPGFWASLFMPNDDRQIYTEGVQRGGYLLTVRVQDGARESSGAMDMDAEAETRRQGGWTGSDASDTAVADVVPGAASPRRAWPVPWPPTAPSRAPMSAAWKATR